MRRETVGRKSRPVRFNMTRSDLRSAKSKRARKLHFVHVPHANEGRSYRGQPCNLAPVICYTSEPSVLPRARPEPRGDTKVAQTEALGDDRSRRMGGRGGHFRRLFRVPGALMIRASEEPSRDWLRRLNAKGEKIGFNYCTDRACVHLRTHKHWEA